MLQQVSFFFFFFFFSFLFYFFTGAKRKERAFESERLSVGLPPFLVRSCFPECAVVESLLAASSDLDRRMAQSLQLWNSYFKRDGGAVSAAPRTLRISVYNLHNRQEPRYHRGNASDESTWTLRVEGRLLPDGKTQQQQQQQQPPLPAVKFSHFVKSISVEVPPIGRSEKRLVEWNTNGAAAESDGFELVVAGNTEVKVKILIVISYPMQLYMLAPPLSKLLGGVEMETHEHVLRGVWVYCQKNNLPSEYVIFLFSFSCFLCSPTL